MRKAMLILLVIAALTGCSQSETPGFVQGLQPSNRYSQYWEYNGEPVLLLGGSDEDNLFQMENLEEHLDLLKACGGNYVRNTMSSRDSGNVWAFAKDSLAGLYNLESWNESYWKRFSDLLQLTSDREIFVQVEVWATFDFYRDNWDVNPFNPAQNINYSAERVKLPTQVPTHPTWCDNPFFWSVPDQHNNMPLLYHQQRFVDKLLSYSLKYDHVLYCIDNETSVTADWGRFWSNYIRKIASEQGKKVNLTEMWDPHELDHISHRETFDHPEIYSFVEISQNNHKRGDEHWNNGLAQIERLRKKEMLRPVNNVKTYGSDRGRHGGNSDNGIQKFIRSAMFGSASVRFHRPASGIGLSPDAQSVILAVRTVSDRMDYFRAEPHNDLLGERTEAEAYCRAIPGKEFLVYFPEAGDVKLDVASSRSNVLVVEIDVLGRTESEYEAVVLNGLVELRSPGKHRIFLIVD